MFNGRSIKLVFQGDDKNLQATIQKNEASLLRLAAAAAKVGVRSSGSGDSFLRDEIRAQKDMLALIAARDRAERANQQARQSSLATAREEIKLERERNRLATQQTGGGGRRQSGSGDPAMKSALADIKRMQAEQARGEVQLTRQIEREAKAQAAVKINEAKRANLGAIQSLKQVEAESSRAAKSSASVFSSVLDGSFFGNLGANAVSFFVSKISGLPSVIRGVLDEAVKISQDKQNAFKGLDSISLFKNINPQDAEGAVNSLRLVKAGVIGVSDGVIGLKNLLATGFSLPQAKEILERFSDAAAFGKQSALSFGEAIRGGTEGIKNQNSNLVDNVGLTKNLSVILKERGFELQNLSDKTKKQSALDALYKGILAETAAQVGDATKITQGYTGAVASLDQAENNLYAATGSIIDQNPEVISTLRLWSDEINGVTSSLQEQDGQQAETFGNLISWLAKAAVKTENWAGFTIGVFKDVYTGYERISTGFVAYLDYGANKIVATFTYALDKITDLYNGFAAGLNTLPSVLGATQMPIMNRDTSGGERAFYDNEEKFKVLQAQIGKYFDTEKGWFQKSNQALVSGANRLNEYQFLINETKNAVADAKAKRDPNYQKFIGRDGRDLLLPKDSNGDAVSGDKKKTRKGVNYLQDLEQLAVDSGFKPGSGFRKEVINSGSLHGSYKALDVSVKANPGKTIDDYTRYIIAGIEKGYRAIDERVVGYFKGIKSTGANVHLEKGAGKKESLFLPQSYYSVPVAYLKQLDEKRRGKGAGGYIAEDIDKFNREQSDSHTKDKRDEMTRNSIELFKAVGLIPTGEMLDRFQSLAVEEARKAKKSTVLPVDLGFDAKYQPTKEEVALSYEANRMKKVDARGDISTSGSVSTDFTAQQTIGEQYVSNLRESLGLIKGKNGEETRYYNLQLLEDNMMELVTAHLEDQALSRREATAEANIEYQILLRRNQADEVDLKFLQSKNDQLRELGDVQEAIALLARQNADEQFTKQRRLVASSREELSLKQSITDLRDELANGGKNDALEIEAAQLRDIVDLRHRETDAVISANRSQLELSNAMKVSTNEIRAQVLDHLAQQETLSSAIASGINKTYDALASNITGTLDALDKKTKGYLSFLIEPAKAFAQNSLSKITSGILDSVLPPGLSDAFKSGSSNPIVNQQLETNKHLKNIEKALTSPISIGGATGGITAGSVVGAISGSSGGGGLNSPNIIKNLIGGGGSANYGSRTGDIVDGASMVFAGDKGRQDIFSNIKNLFSTKDGGLFGKGTNVFTGKQMTKGAGIGSGIGSLMQLGGGLIGGRVGGFLSGAGQGLALGAQLGSIIPGIGTVVGAAVGAIAGGLISLLGGDKNRKQDKKENIPALQKGFTDALAQLKDLSANKNSILQDPDGVIAKATELRGQIASGFGINFLSSKYRKEAQTQIASKLVEADSIINEIKQFAKKAYSAKSLEGQIIGEFASGNYFGGRDDQMKDMRRSLDTRRGYINGGQLGVDRHLGLFADGEMILNQQHQRNINAAAGFNVLAHSGVPNYPVSAAQPIRGYADGNYFAPSVPTVSTAGAPQIVIKDERPVNVTVYVEKDGFGEWKAHAESDSGQKVTANVVEKKYKNEELKLEKR